MARRKATDNGSTAVLDPPEEREEQTAGEEAAPVDPNGWRSVGIEMLGEHGVTQSIVDKLVAADINTLGQMLDYQSDGTELTSIDGIGPETEAKIADAMVAFWAANSVWAEAANDSK